ncbi:MAG: MFS transporter [Thermoprotei archaeon]
MVSYGYGFILILFPLYLKRVGYPNVEVGVIVFAAMLLNAILAIFAGMLADHFGRKYVLIVLLFFFSASSITTLGDKNPVLLSLLAGLAGFTSGATGGPIGSGGPLGAVQTAIISEASDRDTMPKILGIAAILEMASAMAGAFSVTVASLFEINEYYLFYAAFVVGLISIAVALLIKDTGLRSPKFFPSLSYKSIFKLSLPTIPCGLGSGLVIPLLSLWFKIRYGATAGQIGFVFGTMDFAMLVFMWFTPDAASKIGKLKVVVFTRVASSLAFLLMAFSPAFWLAGLFIILRGAFAMGGMPVRQSFVMLNVDKSERATANGSTSFSRNSASSFGAALSGYAMRYSLSMLPFYGGLIALLDPLLYFIMFKEQWNSKRK